jgi:hypothetical protein
MGTAIARSGLDEVFAKVRFMRLVRFKGLPSERHQLVLICQHRRRPYPREEDELLAPSPPAKLRKASVSKSKHGRRYSSALNHLLGTRYVITMILLQLLLQAAYCNLSPWCTCSSPLQTVVVYDCASQC